MARLLIAYFAVLAVVMACIVPASVQLRAEPLSIDSLKRVSADGQSQIPEIADAMQRFRSGKVQDAYALLQDAVKKHSELPPAQVIMAQFFAAVRQANGVQAWLERAAAEVPNDPEAYVMLGQGALGSGRMVEAGLLLNKANDLLKGFKGDEKRKENLQSTTYALLARLASVRKDWTTAQSYLRSLLDVHPENAGALRMLARTLFEEKKVSAALERLKAAKAADEKTLSAQAILAQWYEASGDRGNATKYMIEALTANPRDFRTRFAAADWAFKTKEFKQARKQADLALKLNADSLDANLLAGNIAIFQKDYEAAEKYFKAVLDKSPANFAASNNLALVMAEQDDPAKKELALQYAQMNSRQYPKEAEASSTLGRVLYRMGRVAEAERALRRAATISRGLSPDTAYYIACIYVERDRKSDAKDLLQRAIDSTGLFSQRDAARALLQSLGQ